MSADAVKILNPEERIFQCWGTVEVIDKDGQVLPMTEFEGIMPIIQDRGGNIMFAHSNKQVGKILNYTFDNKTLEDGSTAPGVLITGKVFKSYKFDDEVWHKVLNKQIKGLSFGGRQSNQLDKTYATIKGQPAEILGSIEGFEFSLVENPANQEATMTFINNIAKEASTIKDLADQISDNLIKKLNDIPIAKMAEIQKPFAGYSNFDDCIKQNSDKSNPQAYCATMMRDTEGKSDSKTQGDKPMAEEIKAPEEQKKGEAMTLNAEEVSKQFGDVSKRFETLEKGQAAMAESIATLTKSVTEALAKQAGVSKEEIVKAAVEQVKASFTVGQVAARPELADVTKGVEAKKESEIYKIAMGEKKVSLDDFREVQSEAAENTMKEIFN